MRRRIAQRPKHPFSPCKAPALALLEGPPSDFDNRIYLERAVQASRTAPSQTLVKDNLAKLKRLVANIEARASHVYFYCLPLAGRVCKIRSLRRLRLQPPMLHFQTISDGSNLTVRCRISAGRMASISTNDPPS
jgi:hypothetical protein